MLSVIIFAPRALGVGYTNMTVQQAKNLIETKLCLVVLDVRMQSEYDSGHIRNAMLIPVTELEGRLNELNKTDEILVYCRTGGRSTAASVILSDNGFLHVYNMLGGITEWAAQGYPVYVKYSSIQQVVNNASEGNTIYVSSGTYNERLLVNKSLKLVGENRDNTILNSTDIDPQIIIQADNAEINEFTLRGLSFQNVRVDSRTNVTITDNKILFNALGIYAINADNNTISSNIMEGTGLDNIGIMIEGSRGCLIENNRISHAIYDGIRIHNSNNNLVYGNVLNENDYGIYLYGSTNNTLSNNSIPDNSVGIAVEANSGSNRISGNTFSNNFAAIRISSNHNIILHNNFTNNTNMVSGSISYWDNGCEGNYWSDYHGTDSDRDGVGDTPYIIDSNNTDHYPLMNPYWILADVNHDLRVSIYDVVKITGAYGTTPSDPYWNPHADIAQPYGRIDISDVVLCTSHYGAKYP